jgi:hypothetical protein
MTVPNHFEEQLLSQLRAVVSERAQASSSSRPRRMPALRARIALSGAGVAVAAAIAVVVLAGSGTSPQSAFAVDAHSNGTVTVHVRSLSDAAGLQQSLQAAGVPALVNYAPDTRLAPCPMPKGHVVDTKSTFTTKGGVGGVGPSTSVSGSQSGSAEKGLMTGGPGDPKGLPTPPVGASVISGSVNVSKDGVTFSVTPGSIKPDEQLVITTSEGTLSSIGMAVVKRSVGACSVAPPPAPAP